jgi:hypothetical protein
MAHLYSAVDRVNTHDSNHMRASILENSDDNIYDDADNIDDDSDYIIADEEIKMTMNDLLHCRHDSKNDYQIIFIRKTIHTNTHHNRAAPPPPPPSPLLLLLLPMNNSNITKCKPS